MALSALSKFAEITEDTLQLTVQYNVPGLGNTQYTLDDSNRHEVFDVKVALVTCYVWCQCVVVAVGLVGA